MNGGFLNPEVLLKEFGIKKGMSVADFGCGAGYFSLLLARAVGDKGKVFALDVQQSALESVRSRARQEGVYNIETVWSDLEIERGSTLPDVSQDAVLIANVLFQAPDRKAILKEAWRVVKPGGAVIVIEWEPETPMGPKQESRLPKDALINLGISARLKEVKGFKAGRYHYGVIFTPAA
jgi:ubiquinone/menaquinone biosynthesis C-methylase UbiE